MSMISDILVMKGLITPEQAEESQERYSGDEKAADRDLVNRGIINEQQYAEVCALSLNLKYVNLSDVDLSEKIIRILPDNLMRKYKILPLDIKDNTIILAMADPTDLMATDDVMTLTGKSVQPVVVALDDLDTALTHYVRSDDELQNLTSNMEESADNDDDNSAFNTGTNVISDDSDSDEPIVKFVNLMINQAIQDRASDIHIEPQDKDVKIRYRIDGVLHEVQQVPKTIQDSLISRLKIVSNIDIAEKRKPQDGRMSVRYNGQQIDLRVATLPTVWGENVVMRILDNSATQMSLQDMNMSDHNYEVFHSSFSKPHGMILVTGPTGSGKSTTLYTTLHEISTPEVKVITVEDPVEYRLPGINQVQVNPKAGLTFAAALRSILRSDPDVVLIGEIRDQETANIAVEASLTGHLVLSTLHTNDAPSAVTRLVEMGVEPFLVGSALECVVAQRLSRRLCSRCKKPVNLDQETIDNLELPITPDIPIYEPVGCATCSGTGYKGRVAIHEVMKVTESIEKLAIQHASSDEVSKVAISEGMTTLKMDGWNKVASGLTSIKEVLRVVA